MKIAITKYTFNELCEIIEENNKELEIVSAYSGNRLTILFTNPKIIADAICDKLNLGAIFLQDYCIQIETDEYNYLCHSIQDYYSEAIIEDGKVACGCAKNLINKQLQYLGISCTDEAIEKDIRGAVL